VCTKRAPNVLQAMAARVDHSSTGYLRRDAGGRPCAARPRRTHLEEVRFAPAVPVGTLPPCQSNSGSSAGRACRATSTAPAHPASPANRRRSTSRHRGGSPRSPTTAPPRSGKDGAAHRGEHRALRGPGTRPLRRPGAAQLASDGELRRPAPRAVSGMHPPGAGIKAIAALS
jgi:hypothetical protein